MSTPPEPSDPTVGRPPDVPVPPHVPPWDADTLQRALDALRKK